MGKRTEKRREDRRMELLLLAALLGVVKAMIELVSTIIDRMTR